MDPRLTRFLALGLRSNPFANATFEARDGGPGSPLARGLLAEPGPVVQVVGDPGAGKTHALEWVLDRVARAGRPVAFVHLAEPGQAFAGPAAGVEVFALDEADRAEPGALARLGTWARGRAGRKLLVAVHQDVRARLGSPAAPSFRAGVIGRDELDRYLDTRLARAAWGGAGAKVALGDAVRAGLLAQAGGNWQRLVDLLYRLFEDLGPDGGVDPARVAAAAARLDARGV